MTGLVFCLSVAAMGIDYGWQPVAGGGIEYIIQIEPSLIDSLRAGRDVFSDLPSSVSNVRRYRITVGSGRLPHHGEPPPAPTVVQAGGESAPSAARRNKERDLKSSDVDLSDLPGPVLGPAMVLEPAGKNNSDTEEPQRLIGSSHHEEVAESSDDDEESEPLVQTAAKMPDNKEQVASQEPTAREADDVESQAANHVDESPSDESPAAWATLGTEAPKTLIGLLFSVCGNVFLLWVATDQRMRYRALVRRMFSAPSSSLIESHEDALPRWERLPALEKPGGMARGGDVENEVKGEN